MGASQSAPSGTTFESLCSSLQSSSFRNVVVMCGAGISTSAGVPDFRSPSIGLYNKIRKYDLPYPEAVFDGGYFKRDPVPFYSLVRDIYPERLCPTDAHKFFALLNEVVNSLEAIDTAFFIRTLLCDVPFVIVYKRFITVCYVLFFQKGILRRVYTQNIDALEFLGGLPEDKVVEAHGTFMRSYCTKCKKSFDLPWLKKEMFSPDTNGGVPKCDACGGVVRPDVVLFGEVLPSRSGFLLTNTNINTFFQIVGAKRVEIFYPKSLREPGRLFSDILEPCFRFFELSAEDFPACDLLIVFGTSLAVAPFNNLITKTPRAVPRVYVNRTKPGSTGLLGWVTGMGRSVKFDEPNDLILLGDCDDRVRSICDEIGWREELEKLEVEIMEP